MSDSRTTLLNAAQLGKAAPAMSRRDSELVDLGWILALPATLPDTRMDERGAGEDV
jgi:hypothetical protein